MRNEKTQGSIVKDIQAIRERARQHIEEGALTADYKGDPKTVVKLLNEALATEIVCVLRYKRHYFMAQGMNAPPYTREILRLAASIPYLELFEEIDGGIELRSPTCGSRMRVAVELDWAGRVNRFRQAVEACAYGQATAALVGVHAMGRSAEEVALGLAELEAWLAGKGDLPTAWPGLEALAPALPRKGRHGAILLPFRALLAAIEEEK